MISAMDWRLSLTGVCSKPNQTFPLTTTKLMTPLFRNIAIGTLCAMLSACPLYMEAQYHSGRGGGNHTSQSSPSRSNGKEGRKPSAPNGKSQYGNFRPGGNNNNSGRPKEPGVRPGGNGNHNNNHQGVRPPSGNNHNNQGMRPGNGHNRPDRHPGPGAGPQNNHRPSAPQHPQPGHNWRPSAGNNNHRPGPGIPPPHRPGNAHRPTPPGHGMHHGHWGPPPMRPHRPVVRPWHRPVPPGGWRPRPSAPALSTILGITFGTALNLSLTTLVNNGYYIDGYANNTVYLRDVNSYNYLWPDATLYYSNGGMNRSEFLYSTPYPDPMRYNNLYNNFIGIYGAPVNYVNNGTSLSATWFAPNRGYITLQYAPQYALGGQLRYFTTLTLGL